MIDWKVWTSRDAAPCVHIPLARDDKYSHGVLGVIAGSDEYPGSAVLTCSAALRTGIGMIRYLGTEKSQMLVLGACPEVVTQPGKVQAWSIGSGVDPLHLNAAREKLIEDAISSDEHGVPVLLDAGALQYVGRFHSPTLITPHYRELARLISRAEKNITTEEIQRNPREWCVRASQELNVCVLLKGSTTYISAGGIHIEVSDATPWLATAGTGDVLSGIIGALMATQSQQISADPQVLAKIAATGVLIHSEAAKRASRGGPISASSLLPEISTAVKELISD